MPPAPADPAEGQQQTDARTLFVRNVAFDVDAAQLEEVFTDVGPVRQCFLVTDKAAAAAAAGGGSGSSAAGGPKRHKGIAFVQFALPEDAERALEDLNGKEVAGRRLKVGVRLRVTRCRGDSCFCIPCCRLSHMHESLLLLSLLIQLPQAACCCAGHIKVDN